MDTSPNPREVRSAAAAATLRLLRNAVHPGGVRCPRCHCPRVHAWGRRSGRQRFRCTACRRTFSDFTGTALAYNKRLDRVAAYCQALMDGKTVRAAAATCGIHRTTSFRWRHRLLAELLAQAAPVVTGVVESTEVRFLHSEKGSRSLGRPAYRRGARGFAADRPRNWVLLARDRRGTTAARATGRQRPGISHLEALLEPPPFGVTELIAPAGPASPYAQFCRKHGIIVHTATRLPLRGGIGDTNGARATVRRLLSWMIRFRGVASRYLDNYLRWHAVVDESNRSPAELLLAPAHSDRHPAPQLPPSRPPPPPVRTASCGGPPSPRTERDGRGGGEGRGGVENVR
jgi:transposase-like protein